VETLQHLGIALALGLLIGSERGWQGREQAEGARIAGVRTFGLIALLGALWALLADLLGEVVLGFAFVAFTAVIIIAYRQETEDTRDYGTTTVVAALLTFALGALTMLGEATIAAIIAVVSTTVLSLKPALHHALEQLERRELYAALKLLLISVVLLPVLPNRGYGPWQALNPYEVWWLVVLIATISFAGYFAVKIAGARLGIVLTGLFGGIASSTAVTLNFARLGRDNRTAQALLAAGVIVAATTMFPRILLEVAVVNRELLPRLLAPMGAMAATGYLVVFWLWRRQRHQEHTPELAINNPFELLPALKFGLLLAGVMLLSKAFQNWFGDAGLYLLAAISGLSDVDAITLSMARLSSRGEVAETVAVQAIVLAAVVNTGVKGALVALLCGGTMAWRVAVAFLLTVASGGAAILLLP